MSTTKERISMRSARIFAGMTKEDACSAIGVKLQQLDAWENGKRIPSYEHAVKMADVYGLTVDMISFQKEDNVATARDLLIRLVEDMTSDELDLLMNIMNLVAGRPDRRELAKSWTGHMQDLPAALMKI